MIRRKSEYLEVEQIIGVLNKVCGDPESDNKTIDLISQELEKEEIETFEEQFKELDFLKNTIREQRQTISDLEEISKNKDKEVEFFKKLLVYLIERG